MRTLTAFLFALALISPVHAADPLQAKVRANCGAESYTAGSTGLVIITTTGLSCTTSAAAAVVGNGGAATAQRVAIADIGTGEYETIAASQTNQAMGATGASGDYLLQVVCVPATTSPGVVTVLDNATALVSFPGGASSVSNLLPFTVPVNAYSTSGAWKITTGANVSCVAVGNFT